MEKIFDRESKHMEWAEGSLFRGIFCIFGIYKQYFSHTIQ